MKKVIIILVILVSLSSALMAADTATLSLLLPGDTLTLKFASTCTVGENSISNITGLSGNAKLFTLNKYSSFDESQFDASTTTKDEVYATSAVTFYVIYHALVSKASKIVITAPAKFYSTDGSESLSVQIDGNKIKADGAVILQPGSDNIIVELNSDKVYNGAVKCILALDITNAKKDVKYSGTITMKVVAG